MVGAHASADDVNLESDFVKWLDENGHRVDALDISRIPSASRAQHRSAVDFSTARVRRDSRAFAEVSEVDGVIFSSTVLSQRKENEITLCRIKKTLNRLDAHVAVVSSSRSSHLHPCAELNRCHVIGVSNNRASTKVSRTISVGHVRELSARSHRLIEYSHQNDETDGERLA